MARFLEWWRSWSLPGLFSWVTPIIHTAMSGRPLNEEEVRSWLETDYPQKGGGIDVPKAAEDAIQRLQKGETLIQVDGDVRVDMMFRLGSLLVQNNRIDNDDDGSRLNGQVLAPALNHSRCSMLIFHITSKF